MGLIGSIRKMFTFFADRRTIKQQVKALRLQHLKPLYEYEKRQDFNSLDNLIVAGPYGILVLGQPGKDRKGATDV
jgi:hypothetical protein